MQAQPLILRALRRQVSRPADLRFDSTQHPPVLADLDIDHAPSKRCLLDDLRLHFATCRLQRIRDFVSECVTSGLVSLYSPGRGAGRGAVVDSRKQRPGGARRYHNTRSQDDGAAERHARQNELRSSVGDGGGRAEVVPDPVRSAGRVDRA